MQKKMIKIKEVITFYLVKSLCVGKLNEEIFCSASRNYSKNFINKDLIE